MFNAPDTESMEMAAGLPLLDARQVRWLSLSLAVGGFAIGCAEFSMMSIVPMIAAGLQLSIPDAGNAVSAYAAGVLIGAPLITIFGTGVDRKLMLIGLMLCYALANACTAVISTYHQLLMMRFLSGLPHGAFFGFAGVLLAQSVPPERMSQAASRAILGLTVATIGGVPVAEYLALALNWRYVFILIAAIAVLCAVMVAIFAPATRRISRSFLDEVRVLQRVQVWLTLGIGAVGFGGIFCVYTYLASVAENVTHIPVTWEPSLFAVFGLGMTLGTALFAWLADHRMMLTICSVLVINLVSLVSFTFLCENIWTLEACVFFIGSGGGLGAIVQARLMRVALGGEALAQALNQSAFNVANAIGPLAGGLAISAGLGWRSVGWVGGLFALGGLLIWGFSAYHQRKTALAS